MSEQKTVVVDFRGVETPRVVEIACAGTNRIEFHGPLMEAGECTLHVVEPKGLEIISGGISKDEKTGLFFMHAMCEMTEAKPQERPSIAIIGSTRKGHRGEPVAKVNVAVLSM